MKCLSASETEERFYEIIAEVVEGETIIVTDDQTGEPVVQLGPSGKFSKRQRHRIASKLRIHRES